MRTMMLGAFATCAVFVVPAMAEEIVGRWCNKMTGGYLQEMTIVRTSPADAVMRSRYSDGSSGDQELVVVSDTFFAKKDSATQDHYVIQGDTKDLHVLDSLGLISTARRLPNAPTPGDCF